MSLWLEPSGQPCDLERRVAWWAEREALLLREAPELLASPRPAQAHGRIGTYLPQPTLRADVHGLLLTWFGEALGTLEVALAEGALGAAKSWLEVRDQLPSAARSELPSRWIARLGEAEQAHALCFELFGSPVLGAGVGRYPQRQADLVARTRGRTRVRLWDAGCATGDGTWELALALAADGVEVEALGTTPWPLERLMAERRARPHDPAAGQALAALRDACSERLARVELSFAVADLRAGRPEGVFDLVICHGVLGGIVQGAEARRALEHLVAALAPDGLLSITDRFREDRRAAAQALDAEALRLGLSFRAPGVFRRDG